MVHNNCELREWHHVQKPLPQSDWKVDRVTMIPVLTCLLFRILMKTKVETVIAEFVNFKSYSIYTVAAYYK